MAKDCRAKPTAAFPWSTEDLVKAWQLTYATTDTPERSAICEKIKTDDTLYKTLLSKVKRRTDAEHAFKAQRTAAKDEQRATDAQKRAERELKQQQRRDKAQARAAAEPATSSSSNNNYNTRFDPFDVPDLVPFPPDVVARAKAEVPPDDPRFWSHLYRTYADAMVSRYARMDDVRDPASDVAPTLEFPWSTRQLGRDRNEAAHAFRHDPAFRAQMAQVAPAYNFLLVDQLYDYPDLLDWAVRSTTSAYLPWPTSWLHHLLQALTPEPHPAADDALNVRIALIRHWPHHPLLQRYVANLTPVPVSQMGWLRAAPLDTLLLSYASWEVEGKEFEPSRLQNLWANDVLMRTYELQRASHGRGSTSYYDLLDDVTQHSKDFRLIQTTAGTFLLRTPQELNQLRLQDLPFAEFRAPPPLKWNKTAVVQQATALLTKARAEQKAQGLAGPSSSSAAQEDDADINRQTGSTAAVKDLRQRIRGYFVRLELFVKAIELFLTTLFWKNEGFRLHTSVFAGQIETLRTLYVQAQGRHYDPSTRVAKATVRAWAQAERPPAAVDAFRQDVRTAVYHTVPPLLADSAKRFQQFVHDTWTHLRLPAVVADPPASTCHAPDADEVVSADRRFLQPDHAQLFLNAEFNPGAFENGKLIVHSVGSGKTCLAIRIASDFARAGFRIVWVTKHALRHQVLKNHVSEICNLLVREHYDRRHILEGKAAADAWLQHEIPSQTQFQDVLATLKRLGMDWTNLSYRQFSNALEPEPRNDVGRRWRQEALAASFDQPVDPLRKTLVIVDEAHKLFTGELDRTELPHVPVLHQAFQHSYNTSDQMRCRVLFLTATPTTDSMLPLITLLNMLHHHDVFPYNMATINPHITTEAGYMQHVQDVRQQNQATELQVACDMFPKGLRLCAGERSVSRNEDDDDEDPVDAAAYFDAQTILGGNTFKPHELTNHLQEFWSKAFGLISYYDISADYSKFPRTEYARIALPSATLFQERLMASELLTSKKPLAAQAKKIRQIAAWARFEAVGQPSRQPDALDRLILADNRRQTFFEPTLDDLKLRREAVLQALAAERTSAPDPRDVDALQWHRTARQNVQTQLEERLAALHAGASAGSGELTSRKTKGQAQQEGAITRAIRKLQTQAAGLDAEIGRLEGQLQFHETVRAVKIQYHEKRLRRIEQQHERLEKREHRRRPTQALTEFLQRANDAKTDEPEPAGDQEDEDDEAQDQPPVPPPRRARRPARHDKAVALSEPEDDDENDDDEYDASTAEYEAELRQEERMEEKIAGEYYIKKSWITVAHPLPTDQPRHPKRHYFDQPATFDGPQFLKDLPLYSPKADVFLRLLAADDQDCLKHNPESEPTQRLRKLLIFCQDLNDIRAVAGALVASGWTWGMKRTWVKWQKEFFTSDRHKKVGRTLTAATQQLTWLPTTEHGEDYKRFLVLTRSRLGGVSGATLNDFAIQTLGAKGADATYNHRRNLRGQDYRIILIDRNFIEGIDLPSTYCYLYDAVLAKSDRTQVVGRISRFCGNEGLPFVPNFGWPQRVYRLDLKFHTAGLHLSGHQWERLTEKVMHPDSPYARLIPAPYLQGFLDKLEKNLFSPTELQILLDGNMELQRIRRKTLDVYEALMEKVSIGALLYAPAMRNLAVARHELDELLQEEEETAQEYRREIFLQDEQRRPSFSQYQLRSVDQWKKQWQVHDSFLLSMLQHHVKSALRNTAPELVTRWQDPDIVTRFFQQYVKPDMQNAELIGTSEDHALAVLKGMFDEAVRGRLTRQQEKQQALSRRQAQRQAVQQRKDDQAVLRLMRTAQRPHQRLKQTPVEELWSAVHTQRPDVPRATFDRVYQRWLHTTASRRRRRAPLGSTPRRRRSRKTTSTRRTAGSTKV